MSNQLSYQLNCPVCSEILLPSDVISSTICGHIFHSTPCLSRWLSANTTCPQCRSECNLSNSHRIYLPEVNFQDQEQLLERMNDINRQRQECESKLKKIEEEKKLLEKDLKKKKKDFHKVLRRTKKNSRKNNGFTNIPRSERNKNLLINVTVGAQQSQRVVKEQQSSSSNSQQQPKKKRNSSRVLRSKSYFQRKRTEHRNNNNNTTSAEVFEGILETFSDSD